MLETPLGRGWPILTLLLIGSCEPGGGANPTAPGKTALVTHDFYLRHNDCPEDIEVPERLRVILARLKETKLLDQLTRITPKSAQLEWITQVHSPEYVERARRTCLWLKDERTSLDSLDAPITGRTFDVAVLAVGGILAGVDAVMTGRTRNAFCAIRPPGHHAAANRAMGFCVFNNVAIAARYLQIKYGLKKIFIVDWDCHHGNGTQSIFYDDPTVFYFSTHQSPFYPGTGFPNETGGEAAEGTKLNVPLPKGSGDAEILTAYREQLGPAVEAFRPDFILVSAGFDAVKGDSVGGLLVTPEGYAEMTRFVKALAAKYCKGRLVSTLEGGYSLKQLPGAVEAHVRAMLE